MTKFHLTNFGCRASQADGAALKRQLLDAGLAEAASRDESEIAVLNTCTVTATADAEVRQIIRRIHRANPECRILVTGCYAQRAAEEIAKLPGVAWVVGNSHKHTIAEVLGQDSGVRIQDSGEQKPEVRSQESESGIQNSEFRILNCSFCNFRCDPPIIPRIALSRNCLTNHLHAPFRICERACLFREGHAGQ